MGELETLYGARQHYDLTIPQYTDDDIHRRSSESARVISKECLEVVGNSLGCEDVNALIVILLFWSSVRLSSAEYDVTPPRIPHAKRLEGHRATPEIRSAQPCAFMSFICGCMQVGGLCSRADFFFFPSAHLGTHRWNELKKHHWRMRSGEELKRGPRLQKINITLDQIHTEAAKIKPLLLFISKHS